MLWVSKSRTIQSLMTRWRNRRRPKATAASGRLAGRGLSVAREIATVSIGTVRGHPVDSLSSLRAGSEVSEPHGSQREACVIDRWENA